MMRVQSRQRDLFMYEEGKYSNRWQRFQSNCFSGCFFLAEKKHEPTAKNVRENIFGKKIQKRRETR